MSSYLLLRNNKEVGPLTLEGLLQIGLKPYDLIWVEGRSAAWRYPSEVEELKPYAKPVEEQPFDRFFKKPIQAEAEPEKHITPEKEAAVSSSKAPVVSPSFTEYEAKFIPASEQAASPAARKAVFVTLPKGRNNEAPVSSQPAPVPIPVQKLQAIPEAKPRLPKETAVAEVKYSQPLDNIKEMYVKTLQERKQRASRAHVIRIYGKKAALILALVGAGVLLGFMVVRNKSTSEDPLVNENRVTNKDLIALNDNNAGSDEPEIMPPSAADQSLIPDLNAKGESESLLRLEKPDPGIIYHEQKPSTPESGVAKAVKKTSSVVNPQTPATAETNYGYEPSIQNTETGERAKAVRSEENIPSQNNKPTEQSKQDEIRKAGIPAELAGLIKVASNDYKRVAFGGIRDLRLTVTNESAYALEKVVVELEYLKPNELPLKTELVNFRGIGANESSTIRLPDTNRGIRVNYRIVQVAK